MTGINDDDNQSRSGASNSLLLLPPPLALPRVLHPRPLVMLSATGLPRVARLTWSTTC